MTLTDKKFTQHVKNNALTFVKETGIMDMMNGDGKCEILITSRGVARVEIIPAPIVVQ